MSMLAGIAHAVRTAARMAAELAPPPPLHGPRRARVLGKPVGFVEYQDPRDRYRVRHPSAWVRVEGEGVHVQSPKLGTFLRVELLAEGVDPWEALASSIRAERGRLSILKRRDGIPSRAWGNLSLGARHYRWDGTACDGWLLLLGNVVDSTRPASVELYENRTLAAVRRSFRVPG